MEEKIALSETRNTIWVKLGEQLTVPVCKGA